MDNILETNIETGERLKNAAIMAVGNSNDAWIKRTLHRIYLIARHRSEFTTDAVWAVCSEEGDFPGEPRAMGAAMRRAASEGICEGTDRTVRSVRPACHRRDIRVWRSLVFE